MKKRILCSIILIFIFLAACGLKISANNTILEMSVKLDEAEDTPYFDNVVFITWDGTNAEWFSKLTNNGTLVNCQRVLENGFEQLVRITSHRTSTNPSQATMETGYSADIHGITTNVFGAGSEKPAILDGYTTFERLEDYFGEDIQTASFLPWGNWPFDYTYINYDPSHWDPIFANVAKGTEIDYWFASENLTWVPDDPETLSAILNPFSEATDMYPNYLLNAEFIGNKAAAWVTNHTDERFYLRMHVTEPDQAGHGYGVTTTAWSDKITPEYMEALVISDRAVGAVYDVLEAAGVLNKTLFIIGADHGMYYRSHGGTPWPATNWARSEMTYIFSNTSVKNSAGDIPINQMCIAPTILASLGMDLSTLTPAFVGDDDTGIPLWEFSDTESPIINNVNYQKDNEAYDTLSDGSRIGKVFNISMNLFEWCTEFDATLEIDGIVFDANTTTSKNAKWLNIDASSFSGGSKVLLFTLTDTFGNTVTLEINNVKTAPLSMWITISGFLVLGSIIYIRKRKK
ncbi:MAG: alkaline phosphatase family protein [Candidatus Heimdallarchaeaceae archaeon]